MWLVFAFYGTAGLFVAGSLYLWRHLGWLQRLPTLDTFSSGVRSQGRVRVSVVIAARNEEVRIEKTIRCLLAQREVELKVIAVNDRSTDRTSRLLEELAKEDLRLSVIRVDTLPDGWLGKCHACHLGAGAATGEWILFTDADCWLKPDVIIRAIALAGREDVDHVTLTSGLSSKSPGLRACHLMFLMSIADWISGVNRDRPKAHLGLGAFNLVRASAYRECGGYEALRLTVLDDVKLGLLLRRAGKRTRAFLGGEDVECHWGTTAWGTVKIMEKNYFAAVEFKLWLALLASASVTVLVCVAIFGLFSQTIAGVAAAFAPMCLILPAAILARRIGWPRRVALGVPFVMPVFVWALLNSTYVTLRQGGIRWRGTFYSLKALKAGGVK